MIKSFTNLEQSKQLVKFLPLESADMQWFLEEDYGIVQIKEGLQDWGGDCTIPCWSLTALLNILPYPQLSKDKLGGSKEGWIVSAYPNNCRYDSCWHDNQIDACVEMIIILHGLNLL